MAAEIDQKEDVGLLLRTLGDSVSHLWSSLKPYIAKGMVNKDANTSVGKALDSLTLTVANLMRTMEIWVHFF